MPPPSLAFPSAIDLKHVQGIADYFAGEHDHAGRDRVWADLVARYPDSVWAHRVP